MHSANNTGKNQRGNIEKYISKSVNVSNFLAHLCNFQFGLICVAFCLSVFLSVPKVEKIIHISISIAARGMKSCENMDVGDPKVDFEGQGHRSKVKVTRSKNVISGPIGQYYS